MKVISVETMRQSDKYTIDNFIDSKELMYRAGKGIINAGAWEPPVAIICGSGNNAGDGYVAALILKEKGIPCTVFRITDKCSEDGGYYLDKCNKAGVDVRMIDEITDLGGYRTILDCILGTGFSGEVRADIGNVIDMINESDAFVISADINSGLNGDTGCGSKCVKSDLTVSIGYLKPGLFSGDAQEFINELRNTDIGIVLRGESKDLIMRYGHGVLAEPDARSIKVPDIKEILQDENTIVLEMK